MQPVKGKRHKGVHHKQQSLVPIARQEMYSHLFTLCLLYFRSQRWGEEVVEFSALYARITLLMLRTKDLDLSD